MATRKDKVQIHINAKDKASSTLKRVSKAVVGLGSAYLGWHTGKEILVESTKAAMDYEATLQSLHAVAASTGRNMNDIYDEMGSHVGGLASKASLASGFLKGMTTTLTVQEVSQLTRAIKDASIAMGEDFNTQLPLIIKAIKQLNPNILDNIGVTVRLDQVNKKIRDGYYGLNTEINEATQQHAIFTEVLKQTAMFQGMESQLLQTSKGRWEKLKVSWEDSQLIIGEKLVPVMEDLLVVLTSVSVAVGTTWDAWKQYFNAMSTVVRRFVENSITNLGHLVNYATFIGQALEAAADWDWGLFASNAGLAALEAKKLKDDISKQMDDLAFDVSVAVASGAVAVGTLVNTYLAERDKLNKDLETPPRVEWRQDPLLQGIIDACEQASTAVGALNSDVTTFASQMNSAIGSSISSAAHGMVDMMFDSSLKLRDIFKSMAQDFLHYFIEAIMESLAKKFLGPFTKILTSIFDNPVNDMAAYREGWRFADFFGSGAMGRAKEWIPQFTALMTGGGIGSPLELGYHMQMAGSPAGHSPMTINFNGPVTGEDFVQNVVVPQIQRAAKLQSTRVEVNNSPFTETGVSRGYFS